jgi:hypothetical protein
VTAGEELHREVLEVLETARDARNKGGADEDKARAEMDASGAALTKAKARVTDLRASLWQSKEPAEKVRVADAPPATPA